VVSGGAADTVPAPGSEGPLAEFFDRHRLRVLLASILGVGMCQMTVMNTSFGVFMAPLQLEFAWGRGQLSLALALATVAIALVSPVVGRLIDSRGVRPVVMVSALAFGAAYASLAALTPSLLHFYLVFVVAGVAGAGTNAIAYARAVSGCFNASRGLALGLAMSGVGLTSAVLPFFAQWLVTDWGWRVAYLAMAAAATASILVAGWLLGELPAAEATVRSTPLPNRRWNWQLRIIPALEQQDRRSFILLGLLVLSLAIAVNGTSIHLFPLLTDSGRTPAQAAAYMGLFGIGLAGGKLLVGVLVDRFFAPRVACVIFALVAVALLALQASPPRLLLAGSILTVGLGAAALASLTAYLASRYFAPETFGEVYGYLYGALILGTALGRCSWVGGMTSLAAMVWGWGVAAQR
jgi:MFS family permease